ncbi:LysE family translocator [Brevibacterium sp.]|uniref:LysE family translocator n=1 Tax=Brevibacterium sp. TaxID=1701 RepID=UPI0028109F2C|nr:LysE family translocator [Brevibacterium sp.]
MTITSALIGFAAFAVLLTVIPGLDTTLVLRSSITRSKTYSFSTAAGIQLGTIVWGVATATGATLLLAASDLAYRMLTVAGAAYLVIMGVLMLIKGFKKAQEDAEAALPQIRGNAWQGLGLGFMTNLLNPKVGVFYLATIPQFVPEGVSPLLMGVLLALVHSVIGMSWFVLVVVGGRTLSKKLRSEAFGQWIDRIAGGVIVAFGAQLAVGAAKI